MEKWRFGFGINGGYSKLDWKADDAKTKADGLALAFYGSYDEGPWYMHWQLGGGRTWVDNHRHPPAVSGEGLMSMTTKSNSHVNFYNGRVATGYNVERGKTTVTPVVGIAYVHSFNHGYQEKSGGIFDLIAEPNAQDNLEAQVGVEGVYTTHLGSRQVGLRANVGLGYELMDKVVTLQAGFADFPMLGLFDIQSQNVGRVRGVLGLGVDVLVAKNARLSLEYMGDLKRHQYNNLGAISLKVVF
jgi:outer membrane autotransporter protein